MSKELKPIGDMSVRRFWGGEERGSCIQLTRHNEEGVYDYVQISASEMKFLIKVFKKHIDKCKKI